MVYAAVEPKPRVVDRVVLGLGPLKGKAKVSRRISRAACGVDTANAAHWQMELRSAVDLMPLVPVSSLRLLPTPGLLLNNNVSPPW